MRDPVQLGTLLGEGSNGEGLMLRRSARPAL